MTRCALKSQGYLGLRRLRADEEQDYRKTSLRPLGHNRQQSGAIAGGNVAGGHDTFKGILGSMVTKGVLSSLSPRPACLKSRQRRGYDAISVSITKADRASYILGAAIITSA